MKIIPFSEYIKESPVAVIKDWVYKTPKEWAENTISETAIETQWNKIMGVLRFRNETLELRKSKTSNSYIMGKFEKVSTPNSKVKNFDTRFRIILAGTLDSDPEIEKSLLKTSSKYKNVLNMSRISVHPDYRMMGIGSAFYEFLANSGITVMGDYYQFNGARRLWAELSTKKNLIVDIVDLKKEKIIKHDVILHQNKKNLSDMDNEIWSIEPDESLSHIRPILRKR